MTEQIETGGPTADERTMGALAHFFGLVGALIVWAIQKDRSRFVRFQAAQALAFDFIVMLAMLALFFCLFGVMFLGMFGTMAAAMNSAARPDSFGWFLAFPILLPSLMVSCIFPLSLAVLAARLVATVSVLNGKDFRYPLLGARLEQFLRE